MRLALLPLTAALALSACDSGSEPAAEQSVAPEPTMSPLPAEIPAEFRGRWGLTADACSQEDSEGLLEVTGSDLQFYESVGTLTEVTGVDQGRFRGSFAFSGEGLSWERDVVLDLRDDGEVLVRREIGDDASPEPIDYTKCP